MQDDSPAALPLLAFITGLLFATNALAFSLIAVLSWRFHRRVAIAIAFLALGALRPSQTNPAPQFPSDAFVTIEAPIESDWSARDALYTLRATQFIVNDVGVAAPITIYARFNPPPIELQRVVRATGFLRRLDGRRYAISVKSSRLLSYAGTVSRWSPSTWNRIAHQRIAPYAATNPADIAMIDALVLGRGERLSDEAKENFRRGGTYHLLVFSGLQIALAAAVIAFLLRWCGAARVSDWSLLAFALLAPAFIGPTASVSRSSVGIALYAISRIIRRPTSFENLWCVAALVRLIVMPADLVDPAFQLTYAGAGALIFIGKPLASHTRWRWLGYAAAAEIVVTPLTLFHFHQFALAGSITTIAMTPIVFAMLIAGAIFCVTTWIPLLALIAALNAICARMNECASPLSGFFAAPQTWALALSLFAAVAAIALLPRRWRAVVIASLFIVASGSAIARHITGRTVSHPQAVFLDVGQGDSILVRSGRHNVLVDGGGRSGDARFGETVLLPLLVDRGVRHIDLVVLSHPHPDHCGGLPAVLAQLDVREVWLNPRRFGGECAEMMLESIGARGTPLRLVRDEASTSVADLHLDAFTLTHTIRHDAENNSSIVVRATIGGRSLLLTGDIEREAESELSSRVGHADVLKVAHHGSRSSSTADFLDAVTPDVAVISCGANNWFGHPHASVIAALKQRRINVLRTDRNGTIELDFARAIFIRRQFDSPR